jgi:cytochrome P450
MQEELDRVIGSDRLITVEDKLNLPYCNAVITESQRVANLFAILTRKTGRDIDINGCHVKKGTIVMPQITVIMIDPKVSFKFPSIQIIPELR